MLSLKDIKNYQSTEYERILELGRSIHPKLLHRLGYNEIFDPNFDAEKLDKLFGEKVNQEIRKYDKTVYEMINQHIYDVIDGWVLTHPDSQFGIHKNTGEILTHPGYNMYDHYDEYIIDIGLEEYWQLVYEMISDCKIKPYWKYSQIISGDGYRQHIDSCGCGVNYIKYAREKFKGVKTNYDIITDLALSVESLPYKMTLPVLARETANAIRNDDLNKIIKHHKVLYAFFEKFGKDAPNAEYESHIDSEGKIQFTRIDN